MASLTAQGAHLNTDKTCVFPARFPYSNTAATPLNHLNTTHWSKERNAAVRAVFRCVLTRGCARVLERLTVPLLHVTRPEGRSSLDPSCLSDGEEKVTVDYSNYSTVVTGTLSQPLSVKLPPRTLEMGYPTG